MGVINDDDGDEDDGGNDGDEDDGGNDGDDDRFDGLWFL